MKICCRVGTKRIIIPHYYNKNYFNTVTIRIIIPHRGVHSNVSLYYRVHIMSITGRIEISCR